VRKDFPGLSGIISLNSASMGFAAAPALRAQAKLLESGPGPHG